MIIHDYTIYYMIYGSTRRTQGRPALPHELHELLEVQGAVAVLIEVGEDLFSHRLAHLARSMCLIPQKSPKTWGLSSGDLGF